MTTKNTRRDPANVVNVMHDKYFDAVRRNVANILKERDMTLKDFARENSWNYGALHKALNDNQTISLFSLVRLSKGFNISVCELLNGYDVERK